MGWPEDSKLQKNKSKKNNTMIVNKNGKLQQIKPLSKARVHWYLSFLFILPGIILIAKLLPWPLAQKFTLAFTLTDLPSEMLSHVQRLMMLSFGAVVVVIFRLTLGVRVLGPVRPILIALAFQYTGFTIGTMFLVAVMVVIAAIRPLLRSAGLPYFGRIAMVLSLVSFMVLVTLKVGMSMGLNSFLKVGLLPVVVLTFAAEGFAKTLNNEGVQSASWRALMTILVAVVINSLAGIPGLKAMILHYPEFMLVHLGLIVGIVGHANFKLLHKLNPAPRVKKRNRKSAKVFTKKATVNSKDSVYHHPHLI